MSESDTWRPVRDAVTCFIVIVLILYGGLWGLAAPQGAPGPGERAAPGWVILPLDEYKALRTLAYPPPPEPEPPPVEAALTGVEYDLRVDAELASGTARLSIDVLKEGWATIPLPSGLLIRAARPDGQVMLRSAGPAGKAGTEATVLLSRVGRTDLVLDIDVPVTSQAGNEWLTLPSANAAMSRLSVSLPRQGVDVRLSGAILIETAESAGESRWTACGIGSQPIVFAWRRKSEDRRSTLPLRMRGSVTEILGLGEDSIQMTAEVRIEALQGLVKELRLALPDKLVINQVSGALVADWESKPGALTVSFLEPVERDTALVITGEKPAPREGEIDLPIVRLTGVEREIGGVAVEVLGAGEIRSRQARGLEEVDASELGEMVASRDSPSLLAFRSRAADRQTARSLTVTVARYTPQAVLMANVEEARCDALVSMEGKTLVRARFSIRNNQRNFLKLILPPDATLWSASLAGRPVRPGRAPDGGLLMPLQKGRAGEEAPAFVLELLYLSRGVTWSGKGRARLVLPAVDLPVSRTGLQIYYSPLYRLTPQPGAFRTQTYEPPSAAALRASSLAYNEPAAPAPPAQVLSNQAAIQTLADNFRRKAEGRKTVVTLPVDVGFPALGPSLFFVSELTAENQAPFVELDYEKNKKGGGL
jgi:hypothetical protein